VKLRLDQITVDPVLQVRAQLDEDTIEDYVARLKAGEKFPPVDVFSDENLLAAGHHRLEAHARAGRKNIDAKRHEGGLDEAFVFALASNKAHGRRMTVDDRRAAIEAALGREPTSRWTDGRLADHIGVSQQYVSRIRAERVTTSCESTERLSLRNGREVAVKVPVREAPRVVERVELHDDDGPVVQLEDEEQHLEAEACEHFPPEPPDEEEPADEPEPPRSAAPRIVPASYATRRARHLGEIAGILGNLATVYREIILDHEEEFAAGRTQRPLDEELTAVLQAYLVKASEMGATARQVAGRLVAEERAA
jgi:hypothetical protein